jgi:hypothetical protein
MPTDSLTAAEGEAARGRRNRCFCPLSLSHSAEFNVHSSAASLRGPLLYVLMRAYVRSASARAAQKRQAGCQPAPRAQNTRQPKKGGSAQAGAQTQRPRLPALPAGRPSPTAALLQLSAACTANSRTLSPPRRSAQQGVQPPAHLLPTVFVQPQQRRAWRADRVRRRSSGATAARAAAAAAAASGHGVPAARADEHGAAELR